MKTIYLLLAGLLSVTFLFTSCEKEESTTNLTVESIADELVLEEVFSDVFNEADEVFVGNDLKSTGSGEGHRYVNRKMGGDSLCISVEYQNWRNQNCQNNRVKNGTMTMTMTGNPDSNQFRCTIQLQNFSVDGIQVKGTKEIEKQSENTFRIRLMNGELVFADGSTCTRTAERLHVRIRGAETPLNVWDDAYEITGNAEGKNRVNNMYTHQIKNALLKDMQCRYIVKGVVDITSGENQAILDFGNGECDKTATMTMNGNAYTVNLER